ncbi:IS110 family RNA-guided transposase [Pontibacter mangrovi]|uniref:IS110 family transposase n=1 Tax=Pontibacter mangrovi TaxID=2589816 RepID=A0A501VTD3_9BACT|nr:IS110 family transposase [Pontibacter mangrovi]TPE39280.1 IS110 family transposase [Pontibacter mangrovi]
MQNVIGIDVSKETLVVCHAPGDKDQHLEVSNNKAGFQRLLKSCGGTDRLYVMEATGAYYMQLAYFLHSQGAAVAVINPVVIKRFVQMHLGKGKSDKKDAQWIMRYGQQNQVKQWQPETPLLVECRQLEQAIEQLIKQKTMISNSLEALERQPVKCLLVVRGLKQTSKLLQRQIGHMERELQDKMGSLFSIEMDLLVSIPGIGRKTAGMLLLFAGGFQQMASYRQLIAKAGLCPREYTSGTSIRGKVRITKMGGSLIRSKLYMCSLTAMRGNAACKELYERLVARGKNGKVALIAVCNKLLKQAFAIVKSGIPYQAEFSKTSPQFA